MDHAGRSTPLFGPGDHDGADAARRVPPGSAADRRADRLRHRLLGLDLAIPDHSTLSRRAETLAVAGPPSSAEPVHLLVDSTGLKLSGAGEWLVEKHGTSRRRWWRKLHIGVDADTGRIVAATLTTHHLDDGSQVGPLLDQIDDPIASLTGDGASDQDGVYGEVG